VQNRPVTNSSREYLIQPLLLTYEPAKVVSCCRNCVLENLLQHFPEVFDAMDLYALTFQLHAIICFVSTILVL
jgi:hypothetical protein